MQFQSQGQNEPFSFFAGKTERKKCHIHCYPLLPLKMSIFYGIEIGAFQSTIQIGNLDTTMIVKTGISLCIICVF